MPAFVLSAIPAPLARTSLPIPCRIKAKRGACDEHLVAHLAQCAYPAGGDRVSRVAGRRWHALQARIHHGRHRFSGNVLPDAGRVQEHDGMLARPCTMCPHQNVTPSGQTQTRDAFPFWHGFHARRSIAHAPPTSSFHDHCPRESQVCKTKEPALPVD